MARRAVMRLWQLTLLGVELTSCTEYGPRIYTARPYEAGDSCLEPSVPIAIVQAAELALTPEPHCLLLDETLFVSALSEPYPSRAEPLGAKDSADCARAIELFCAEAFCETLGSDAGTDDAGTDDAGPRDARPPTP
jgi:hypothetical protein